MSEIGNYYEPYRRRMRELEAARKTRDKHMQRWRECERLVDEGEMEKVVTVDPRMHCTRIHYEPVNKY